MNNRRTNKIIALAGAVLMLALLAVGFACTQDPGVPSGHTAKIQIAQAPAGMSTDDAQPLTGLGRASASILKSGSFTAYAGGSSGTGCKAVSEKPFSFFSAGFRRVLPAAHIAILYETFGTPAGCRAPPALSLL